MPRDPPVQAAPGPGGPARAGSGAAVPAGPAQPQAASTLGLDEDALRDLFLIIEISQEHVPAAFRKETADAREAFTLSLAYSPAFERHVRERHPRAAELGGAPILIFSAVARRAEAFYGNLTFSQGHLAFSPDPGSSLQLGVLQGRLGELEAGEVVLGYVALPERMELHQPVGIYWNDRHTEVAFLP